MKPDPTPEELFRPLFQAIERQGLVNIHPPLTVEPVEYRTPLYSRLARVLIHSRSGAVPAYVKIIRLKNDSAEHLETMRARVRKEFELAAAVRRGMTGDPHIFSVRPLGCFPDLLAYVTEEAAGEPLINLIEREAAWHPTRTRLNALRSLLSTVGAWARRFQSLEPRAGRVSRDDIVDYLDVRLRRLVQHPKASFSEVDRARLLKYCAAMCRRVDDDDLREVWTHADFGPSNVLAHRDSIAVLDFAMAHPGTIYTDVARMFTQLEWFAAKPRFQAATVRALQEALLEGFDPQFRVDAPLFELMVLQHRVNHFLGTVERRGGVLSTLYNWHLARRDRGWMRERGSAVAAMEPA